VSEWRRKFFEWYNGHWPEDYISWDMETTGFKTDYDLPVDIGHVVVRGGNLVDRGGTLLNWPDYPGIEEGWLHERMDKTAFNMQKQGKTYGYSVKRLRAEGEDPYEVLKRYYTLFQENRESGGSFLGHGVWHFDSKMFSHCLQETCGLSWEFGENELWDSGAIDKATQAQMEPFPDEHTLKKYFLRVHYSRKKGVYWNIESCVERYKLAERYGVDVDELHGAEADSYVSHLLFEDLRALHGN
jgi:hypothetical protein